MNISEIKNSRFLTKEDCGDGIVVTIDKAVQDNVALPDQPAEMKYTLEFEEDLKPLVLNATNAELIALFLGSKETDDWQGEKVVLFNDETVSFAGKIVGGIRARRYEEPAEAIAKEDIPF